MGTLDQPIRLASNLYLVYHEWPHRDIGNVYVITGRHNVLVDCGSESSFNQIKANLRHLKLRPSDISYVIATHGDYDHTQGFLPLAARCSNIPLLLHRDDWLSVIKGDAVLTKAYVYGQPYHPLPAERCIPLSGHQFLAAGNGEVLFIHTPGHSVGSSCLLAEFDGQRWLIAGDTVGGAMIDFRRVGPKVWSRYLEQWQASLAWLSQLEFDWIVTGHDGQPLSRQQFNRKVGRFGHMLNPWFSLDESPSSSRTVPPSLPISPMVAG